MIRLTDDALALVLEVLSNAIRRTDGEVLDILEELEEPYIEEDTVRYGWAHPDIFQ